MSALFTLAVGTPSGPDMEVTDFTSWTLDNNLDDGCTISFDTRGFSQAAPFVDEMASDVFLYRGSSLFQRFRVASVDQSWDADGGDVVAVRGVCYRRLLQVRHVITPVTYTTQTYGTIIWNLIQATQATTSGNLGITAGSIVTTTTATVDYVRGQNIFDAISEFTKDAAGIEWEIDANLQLQVRDIASPPYTVAAQPIVLGVNARTMSRPSSADRFANVAIVSGDQQSTTPVVAVSSTLGTDPRGRWEQTASITTAKRQNRLQRLADGLVETFISPASSWRIEMEPSRYFADSEYLPGTYCTLVQPRSIVYPAGTPAPTIIVQIISRQVAQNADGQVTVNLTAIEVS